MQIFELHKRIYKLADYVLQQENISAAAECRKKALEDWELLKRRRVCEKEIAKVTGISRPTYYRRKKAIKLFGLKGFEDRSKRPHKMRQSQIPQQVIDLVLRLRQESPTYGKAKIHVILRRDHNVHTSESSVGRILHKLLSEGKIVKSLSAARTIRKRVFNRHAQKWSYGMKGKEPGELLQADHMTVTKNGICFKHFQLWDPVTKVIFAKAVSNATSSAAAKFLIDAQKQLPFQIKSVQVDGGSEFMGAFEETCGKLNIPLYVLPPKKPKYNGGVERGNRIFREEFYATDFLEDSVRHINILLQKAVNKYNSFRPHFRLNGLTPFEYNERILARAA